MKHPSVWFDRAYRGFIAGMGLVLVGVTCDVREVVYIAGALVALCLCEVVYLVVDAFWGWHR